MVSYSGRPPGQPVYRCDRPNLMLGLPRCFTFGGLRVDAAIARELLRVVEPMAIEAALEAQRRYMEGRVNNSASWNWSCNRLDTKPRLRNGATLPVIPTIVSASPDHERGDAHCVRLPIRATKWHLAEGRPIRLLGFSSFAARRENAGASQLTSPGLADAVFG
jgi:hypothetical protein